MWGWGGSSQGVGGLNSSRWTPTHGHGSRETVLREDTEAE